MAYQNSRSKLWTIALAAILLTGSPLAYCAEGDETAPGLAVSDVAETPADAVWHGMLHANMLMRYHSSKAGTYGFWALVFKIALPAISLFILVGGILHQDFLSQNPQYGKGIRWASAVALVVSISFNFIPMSDWRNQHAVLAQRWNAQMNDWKHLRVKMAGMDEPMLVARVDALSSTASAIENSEPPTFDPKLIAKCQAATEKEFGIEQPTSAASGRQPTSNTAMFQVNYEK